MVNNFIQRYCDGLAGKVTGFCTLQGTSKKSKVHLYQLKTIEVFASPLAQSFINLPGLCSILLHVQYTDAVDDCVVGQVQVGNTLFECSQMDKNGFALPSTSSC